MSRCSSVLALCRALGALPARSGEGSITRRVVLALVALALVWTVVLTAPAGASSFGHCPASDALVCTQHSCYLPAACVSMQLRVAALWHSNGSAPGASSALAALALGDPVARLHLSARLGLPRATHPPTHCPAHRCRPCLYRHSVAHCPPGRASAPSTASAGRGADALCEPPALGAQLRERGCGARAPAGSAGTPRGARLTCRARPQSWRRRWPACRARCSPARPSCWSTSWPPCSRRAMAAPRPGAPARRSAFQPPPRHALWH